MSGFLFGENEKIYRYSTVLSERTVTNLTLKIKYKLYLIYRFHPRERSQTTEGRWSKKSTFCKLLYHRKCKRKGVGGQKKPNLVNVVCERPPT